MGDDSPGSRVVFWCAISILIVMVLGFIWFLYREMGNPGWEEAEFKHFPAVVGLSLAAAAAFVMVSVFRAAEGQIKFEGWGLKFEGASGPIIMWLLCFLAITAGIKLLW